MKKKFLIWNCLAVATVLTVGGVSAVNASASAVNAEGWELRSDGYYYEVDPPITDLFDYSEPSVNGVPAMHMYVLDYSGLMETDNFSSTKRELLTLNNGTISTNQAVYAQYDDWGKDYFRQSNETVSEAIRHLDFTFMVDFTNLNGGYFKYRNDSTVVSVSLANNQIIIEEKAAANGASYTWSNIDQKFINYPGDVALKDLTGWQQVTVLIEERVSQSSAEITRNDNKGAQVTVTVGEQSVSATIDKMGYYFGVFGVENHTGTSMPMKSTKEYYEVAFETNGGGALNSFYKSEGAVLGELPTPSKGAYPFLGWYTTEDFQSGTECSETTQVTADMKLYAKWLTPASVNADGWVLGEDNYYHNAHLTYKDIFDSHEETAEYGTYDWYQLTYEGTYGQQGFTAVSRTAFTETANLLQNGKMLVSQSDKSIDYVLGNSTWQLHRPSSYIDYDFAFEIDFTPISSGTLQYINDNIYITLDFTNDQIIIENREAAMKYEDWSWPIPRERFVHDFDGLSDLMGRQQIRLMIDERVKATKEEMTRDGNNGAVVTVQIGNQSVVQPLEKLGYYVGILGFINNTNASISFYSVKTQLIKEQINGYLKESDYKPATWATIAPYVADCIGAVDAKNRNELDAYYAEVAKKLDTYPTAREEDDCTAKRAEVLGAVATAYPQTAYDTETWTKLQAIIIEYTAKINASIFAKEVEDWYNELTAKADAYFTVSEMQEKATLVAQLNAYGNQNDYDEATWEEICAIKAEYLAYIEKAPSVWDVEQLVNAAKADVDSFKKLSDPTYQPDSSQDEKKGCSGTLGIGSALTLSALAIVLFVNRKRKNGTEM